MFDLGTYLVPATNQNAKEANHTPLNELTGDLAYRSSNNGNDRSGMGYVHCRIKNRDGVRKGTRERRALFGSVDLRTAPKPHHSDSVDWRGHRDGDWGVEHGDGAVWRVHYISAVTSFCD